ncbi:RNA pseudouridine synthase [Candidatus Falkowbacteria bacterium]|jgi:23S rRNA pseudouridine1911/1915/1917 synthase|nr:RNA pseudouridine synthase [Candidatus Falkowbacteria bacterium]
MTTITFPEIISETKDYLVINKPAGLAVHGGGNIKEVTLADLLIKRYPEIKTVGDNSLRPGIVHRLDKEVSGLMVIAKNQETFLHLKNQFKDRDVNKEYLALVHGKILNDSGEINFPIKRSQAGHKMAALPNNAVNLLSRRHPTSRDQGNIEGFFKAREAITLYTVIQRFINFTLVQVNIKTGRTHQIRVHFFALGHPLVGDSLYFNKKAKIRNQKNPLGRIFLVATKLSFKDLKGESKNFSLEMPSELTEFLKTIK